MRNSLCKSPRPIFEITNCDLKPPALVGLIVGLLVFLVPLVSQSQVRSKHGLDTQQLSRMSARMKSFVDEGAMVGAVMLVDKHGEMFSVQAVGFQELESRKPMRADTIFDVRSVTKIVTAMGVMILVDDGKLGLHDPIEKYLPEFKRTNSITIHHLLTHTSGLPFSRPAEIEDITVKRDRTLADVVSVLSKQESEFAPGTQFRYYSGGFAILGRIVEVVSGMPYEKFIKERLFDPLGMRDSSFFIPAEKQHRVAPIYRRQNGKLERWREIEEYSKRAKYPGPEFGMYSTAEDLSTLGHLMLEGGVFRGRRILSSMAIAAMTANHTMNIQNAVTRRPAFQGLAWGLYGDPLNDFPLTSAGSYGHNGAFGSIIWIDPKERLIRIFLEHLFGAGSEVDVFMSMAGAAVVN